MSRNDIEALYEKMHEGALAEALRLYLDDGPSEIPGPLGIVLSPEGRANDVSESARPALSYTVDWERKITETIRNETLELKRTVSDELTVTMDDPDTLKEIAATYILQASDEL